MASSTEDVTAGPNTEADEGFEDSRNETKKKKSKPFKKLRNFFRGSSKKRLKGEGDVTLKSHSVTALYSKEGEDDDDGGFKRVPVGLAGSRSISEDSIFKPEQTKEQPIGVLHGTAVSMERINSDFQSVPAGGKSTSLESDRSLLSIDGSETEEDLFQSNWKAGVASVSTKRPSSSGSLSDITMDLPDLDAVEMRTEKLSNEGAKHRISVKPKSRRASTKTSMKQKEKPQIGTQLPEVKEESPTKISVGEASDSITDKKPNVTKISTTISVGNSPIPRSEPKDIPQPRTKDETDATRSHSMSPLSTSPVSSAILQDVKLRPRPASGKFDEVKTEKEEASSELSNAFNRVKRFSKKFEEDVNADVVKSSPKDVTVNVNVKEKEEPKFGISLKGVSDLREDKKSPNEETKSPLAESKTIIEPVKDTDVVSPGMPGVSFVLKKEPLRPATARQDSTETKIGGISKAVTISETKDRESDASRDTVKTDSVTPSKSFSSKGLNGSPEKLPSPREDYKLKRQLRSKTLPEQPVPKEMLDKAKEADSRKPPLRKPGSPPVSTRSRGNYDNVVIGTKPIQSKRASWAPETTKTGSVSAEPSWIATARQKQIEHEKVKSKKDSKDADGKTEAAKIVDKSATQATVKVDEKAAPQTNVASSEKTDTSPAKSVSENVTMNEKANVKSWTQSYSAKPFEKTSNLSSVKAPSVHSSSIAAKSVTEKSLNVQIKPTLAQSSIKPSIQPTSVSAVKPGFDRTASQKASTVTAKPAFDSKSVTQSPARPFGSANANISKEPVKTSVASVSKEPIKSSVTSDSKKPFSVETKKVEEKKDIKSSAGGFSTRPGSISDKKTPDAGGLPPWKQKKNSPSQVKIEIIDKTDNKADQNKTSKVEEQKKSVVQAREKGKTETCSDSAANKPSRVLDMVKNFQKLQVT